MFRQITQKLGYKGLRFGQIVYILVFYNISFCWLLPLDGFEFIFLCRVYCVTVKTKNSKKCLANEAASNQPAYATDISIIKEIMGDGRT